MDSKSVLIVTISIEMAMAKGRMEKDSLKGQTIEWLFLVMTNYVGLKIWKEGEYREGLC